MLSPKELKKLAAACREAGIKHYKTADFEFTLTDTIQYGKLPLKPIRELGKATSDYKEEDQLTEDQIMFWSAADDKIGN